MCSSCGCETGVVVIEGGSSEHARLHAADMPHSHGHDEPVGHLSARILRIEQDILA